MAQRANCALPHERVSGKPNLRVSFLPELPQGREDVDGEEYAGGAATQTDKGRLPARVPLVKDDEVGGL